VKISSILSHKDTEAEEASLKPKSKRTGPAIPPALTAPVSLKAVLPSRFHGKEKFPSFRMRGITPG